MICKQANQIVPGDKIESIGGIFEVTDARHGIGDTVLLRGKIGDNPSEWATYSSTALFDVVTVH